MEDSELRGPSWSWASVDGKITMTYWEADLAIGATTILTHVIDAEIIPVTGDEFGLIRGGKVRILSSLGIIRLPITDDGSAMSGLDDPAKKLQDQEVKIAISWDTLEMASLLDPHRQNLFEELNRKENLMEIWTYFTVRKYDAYSILPSLPPPSLRKTSLSPPAEVIRDVFHLPLHIMDEYSEVHSHRTLKGLLLMPTQKEKGEFRRVGQFEVLYDEVYNKTSTEAMKRSTVTLDPEYYESADGQSQYIMTII